jgi:hypothetical protein
MPERGMSALGQKQTFAVQKGMSALPPKADIHQRELHVRFVPKACIALTESELNQAAKNFR